MGMIVDEFVARAKRNRHRRLIAKLQNIVPDFLPTGWTYDDRHDFEERAAFLEFSEGLSRAAAERQAVGELNFERRGDRRGFLESIKKGKEIAYRIAHPGSLRRNT